MTCQKITGSDVFHRVHYSLSTDNGKSWSEPAPISSFGHKDLGNNLVEGVCDVVPEYHQKTDTVLAIAHNVFYNKMERKVNGNSLYLTKPNSDRHPVYSIRNSDGSWSKRKTLDFKIADKSGMYTAGSAQRVTLENGDIIIPISLTSDQKATKNARMICSCLCSYDGEELKIKEHGNTLRFDCGRGLLEPSIIKYNGMYYMTIRTEDNRAYLSFSEDGLQWQGLYPWNWDNGEQLITSTTQQHWLEINNELWLVYTRKSKDNEHIMRWRAPLYMAKVSFNNKSGMPFDKNKNIPCLIRNSEKTIIPIRASENDTTNAARMGNFDVRSLNENEALLTVGECLIEAGVFIGDTIIAKIKG
jgi:hypothetical protein